MRVTLNLASQPYVELRPLYQRLRVVALLLLVTAGAMWWVLRTEQKKASVAHARATTIDSAMDAIITVDANQRIILFNKAAESLFHCLAADVHGEKVRKSGLRRDPKGTRDAPGGTRHQQVDRKLLGRLSPG